MIKNIAYKKGDKLFCKNCGDHILTFKQNAHMGQPISEALFRENEGQGPWRWGERGQCRKCGIDFYFDLMRVSYGTHGQAN